MTDNNPLMKDTVILAIINKLENTSADEFRRISIDNVESLIVGYIKLYYPEFPGIFIKEVTKKAWDIYSKTTGINKKIDFSDSPIQSPTYLAFLRQLQGFYLSGNKRALKTGIEGLKSFMQVDPANDYSYEEKTEFLAYVTRTFK